MSHHNTLPASVAGFIKRLARGPMLVLLASFGLIASAANADSHGESAGGTYKINPGDVLSITVWNEPTLSLEVAPVRPDGFISIPVVGELGAGGRTIVELQDAIVEGFSKILRDKANVVVSVVQARGSSIYVLGKVARPGSFSLTGPMDVTQALAMAGGLNNFAAEGKIKILRRDANGVQGALKFSYAKVKDGEKLQSNILLQAGDVVLVP